MRAHHLKKPKSEDCVWFEEPDLEKKLNIISLIQKL